MKDTLNLTGAVNGFQLKPEPVNPNNSKSG